MAEMLSATLRPRTAQMAWSTSGGGWEDRPASMDAMWAR